MEKGDEFVKLIKRTIYMDKGNYVIAFTGHPNSGKSYGALDLALTVDPTFTEERICFTIDEFYDNLLKLDKEGNKVGKALILDEAGVAGNSKKAMHSGQVGFGEILKMMRFKRNLFIITTPSIGDYLKDGRALIDARVHYDKKDKTENEKIKKIEKRTRALVRLVSSNYYNNKIYLLPMQTSGHELKNGCYFDLPPKWLVKAYDNKKTNNFNNILEKNLLKLKNKENKENRKINRSEGNFIPEIRA